MRFKLDLPEGYAERQKYYMQLSDSDDDDEKPDRSARTLPPVSTKSSSKKKGGKDSKAEISFKREKPLFRERPSSAKPFRTISLNDPEVKVDIHLLRFPFYRIFFCRSTIVILTIEECLLL
jgi:hypothetical protein